MESCRIGIIGCGGKMGRILLAETLATEHAILVGGTDKDPAVQGQDLGELAGGKPISLTAISEVAQLFQIADVLIDFTHADTTATHANLAADLGKGLVVGTTGHTSEQMRQIIHAGERAAMVMAPNMSLGINLLLGLVEQAAAKLGPDWDIEILEMHHRHKVDAPSGTALGLGRAAAAGRGVNLPDIAVKSRDGQTGARPEGSIGFATLRGGDVVGEHQVIFAGEAERVEFAHKATNRLVFAKGAVRAALWLRSQPPGIYGMRDVLGLPEAPPQSAN